MLGTVSSQSSRGPNNYNLDDDDDDNNCSTHNNRIQNIREIIQ